MNKFESTQSNQWHESIDKHKTIKQLMTWSFHYTFVESEYNHVYLIALYTLERHEREYLLIILTDFVDSNYGAEKYCFSNG